MCGVPVNAAPDMTGLGGKARMVTTTVAESSVDESKNSSENKEVVKPAENLLLEVSLCVLFTFLLLFLVFVQMVINLSGTLCLFHNFALIAFFGWTSCNFPFLLYYLYCIAWNHDCLRERALQLR